jgi:hypothetical protein
MRTIAFVVAVLGLVTLFAACSTGSTHSSTLSTSDTADASQTDTADTPDTSAADVDATAPDAAATVQAWSPPPLAPPDEGTMVALGQYAVAAVLDPAQDQVDDALFADAFAMPQIGVKSYGLSWAAKVADKDGQVQFSGNPNTYAYAAVEVPVPKAMGIVVRADRAFDVMSGGWRQPGDIYGHGNQRVPLRGGPGNVVVVARGRGGQKLKFAATTTSHEAVFNVGDRTFADLRAGQGEESWLGVPVLVIGPGYARDVVASVVESDKFTATQVVLPALAGGAVTQVPFRVQPKSAPKQKDEVWTAELRIASPSWQWSYSAKVEWKVLAPDVDYRQSFRSPDDGSVQFYGVSPPKDYDPKKSYALDLSLHGAGVDAYGQAGAYGARDWIWVACATNRRPFGFDWEEWGRLNAIFTLDDAQKRLQTDPTRTYLSGHSMGGHGTWHVGLHHAGRFATVGPSAGWNSFYTYGGAKEPTGVIGRARAHSKTTNFIGNLALRGAYVIHGTADDNVPWSEGKAMLAEAEKVTKDALHHWEEGAGHWWDNDTQKDGADCVDWDPMFAWMQTHTLDRTELAFNFRSAGPHYSASYSFATILSSATPMQDCTVKSEPKDAKTVKVTTGNVRTLEIDGAALRKKGVDKAEIDGQSHDVPDGPLLVGAQTGKRRGVTGPYNQVMHRPWLYVYPDGDAAYMAYAAYLVSDWNIIGNGHAGALPLSAVQGPHVVGYNLIWLGVPKDKIAQTGMDIPFSWDAGGIGFKGTTWKDSALLTVFDNGERLNAVLAAAKGKESLLYGLVPFSSRSGLPDYVVLTPEGGKIGFYDSEWKWDSSLAQGF